MAGLEEKNQVSGQVFCYLISLFLASRCGVYRWWFVHQFEKLLVPLGILFFPFYPVVLLWLVCVLEALRESIFFY